MPRRGFGRRRNRRSPIARRQATAANAMPTPGRRFHRDQRRLPRTPASRPVCGGPARVHRHGSARRGARAHRGTERDARCRCPVESHARRPQPVSLTAGVRRDDPGRELLQPLLEIRSRHGRQVEDAVMRGRRLVNLHQQPATARVCGPGHLPRRIAAAKLAQARPFLVAGAMHGRRVAAARGLGRWLAPSARHGPREHVDAQVRVRPGTEQPERKSGR